MSGPSTALVVWGHVSPAPARVNWGRWIADCPSCGSALAVEPGQPLLGATVWEHDGEHLTAARFQEGCWDCGTVTDLVWPDAGVIDGVERLLAMRPDPKTRNWEPHESLHHLMRENAEHGIFSQPAVTAALAAALHTGGAGRELLAVGQDGRIVVDALPATRPLSSRPRAIGA